SAQLPNAPWNEGSKACDGKACDGKPCDGKPCDGKASCEKACDCKRSKSGIKLPSRPTSCWMSGVGGCEAVVAEGLEAAMVVLLHWGALMGRVDMDAFK